MGFPPYIVARLARWRSISAMLEYLTTDLGSLISYAGVYPSNVLGGGTLSGLSWHITNNRLFGHVVQRQHPVYRSWNRYNKYMLSKPLPL